MKKLLVVVDYQVDFISGSLGFEKAEIIKPNIIKKIENYIDEDNDIIFTLDTHYDNYLDTVEGNFLPVKHCIKGSFGHDVHEDIKPYLDKVMVIEKNSFGSKELATFLEKNFYDEIEFCGLVSNICVLSNAIIAQTFSPNSNIIIDINATTSHIDDVNKTFEIYLNSLGIKTSSE